MITELMLSAVLEFVRLFIVKHYFDSLFPVRRKEGFFWCLFIGAFLCTIVPNHVFRNTAVNILSTYLGFLLLTLAYEMKYFSRILNAFVVLVVAAALDVIAAFALSVRPTSDNYEVISAFLSVLLFFVVIFLLKKRNPAKEETEITRYWWQLLAILCMSIFVMFLLADDAAADRDSTLVICFTILGTDLISYYFYESVISAYAKLSENMILREQIEIYANQRRLEIESSRKTRELRHDLKHHIGQINRLLQDGKTERALAYLSDMKQALQVPDLEVSSGNYAMDGILNYMIADARKKGIAVSAKVRVPESLTFPEFDMNVIIGNLMDNAVEAAADADNPEIRIDLSYQFGCVFLLITNTYRGEIRRENGRFLSTKEGKGHGMGLISVADIVRKYDGEIQYEYDEQLFRVHVMLGSGASES